MSQNEVGSIVLSAEARIDEGSRAEFLSAVGTLRAASRAEEGVIAFGFYEDPTDRGLFLVREEYRDQAAMDQHMRQPHTVAYVEAQAHWLAEPAAVAIHTTAGVERFEIAPQA